MKTQIWSLVLFISFSIIGCTSSHHSSGDSPTALASPVGTVKSVLIDLSGFNSSNVSVSTTSIDFGQVTPQNNLAQQVLVLSNSSSGSVSFVLDQSLLNKFQVLFNHCPSSLASGQSCSLMLAFNGQGLYNNTYTGTLSILDAADPTESVLVGLTAAMTQNPDPASTDGSVNPNIIASMNDSFTDAVNLTPYRVLTLTNAGNGDALLSGLTVGQLFPGTTKDLSILLSHCGNTLTPGQSCQIFLLNNNFRVGPISNPDVITINFDATGTSGPQSISFDLSKTWTWLGGSNLQGAVLNIPTATLAQTSGVFGSNTPPSRFGGSFWTGADGKFYLFGGETTTATDGNTHLTNDFWVYDPGTNQWAYLMGNLDQTQSVTDANGNTTYPTHQGHYVNVGQEDPSNIPGGRDYAAFVVGKDGKFYLFGGSGIDVYGNSGYLGDLWVYNPQSMMWAFLGGSDAALNLVSAPVVTSITDTGSNIVPIPRMNTVLFTDKNGDLYIFGGDVASYVYPNPDGSFSWGEDSFANDVWKFSLATAKWSQVSGSTAPDGLNQYDGAFQIGVPSVNNLPSARSWGSAWTTSDGMVYIFGGMVRTIQWNQSDYQVRLDNTVWAFNPSTLEWTMVLGQIDPGGTLGDVNSGWQWPYSNYGTMEVMAPTNIPSGRVSFVNLGKDSADNLYIFGGIGFGKNNPVDLLQFEDDMNDVWKFTPSSNCIAPAKLCGQWTWVSGYNGIYYYGYSNNELGTFGTLGIPSSMNMPGGREAGHGFMDANHNIYIFGGLGYDSLGNSGEYTGKPQNDLFMFNSNQK